jgi:hypothetical protein
MSRTSAVSAHRLMPVPLCNLMMTSRHGNSYTCRTVKVVLVTDELQSVRKVDYLVRRRCNTLLEFAWWLNHAQSRCVMCCSGKAEQRLLEMPQKPRNAPLQVIVCPDVIGALVRTECFEAIARPCRENTLPRLVAGLTHT